MKYLNTVLALVFFVLLFFLGVALGRGLERAYGEKPKPLPPQLPLYEIESKVRDQVRKEAAEAGVAYFELNQKTGEIEFHYVDIQRVIQSVAQQMQQQMRQIQAGPLQ